jgi:hypothetical protein
MKCKKYLTEKEDIKIKKLNLILKIYIKLKLIYLFNMFYFSKDY